MITRTLRTGAADYIRLMRGYNPRDEWRFEVDGLSGVVVNQWRTGADLIIDHEIVASTTQLLAVSVDKPLLEASVVDSTGQQRTIAVYMRAILTVKIRIDIDGTPITPKFM